MRKMENTSDHNRENNVCLWTAFIVGGVGFLVLTPFVSSIWLSFCLSFRPDKHHYSVCWSWQRPHQCKHPHTETGQLYLTPCTHLTVSMFSSDPSFSWLAEQFKVNKLFLMGKPGVNKSCITLSMSMLIFTWKTNCRLAPTCFTSWGYTFFLSAFIMVAFSETNSPLI